MSPSKRAGDTVDESIDDQQASETDEHPPGAGERSAPRRRSVLSSGIATPPERGSSSQRGTSSSTITKRGRFPEDVDVVGEEGDAESDGAGAAVEAVSPAAATPAETPVEEVSVDEPLPRPAAPTPPTARVDPTARRPFTGAEPFESALPLPMAIPAGAPVTRESTALAEPDRPMPPPDPPYVTTTMTSHGVAPVPRVLGRRPRVRRVTRVVRHVDPWSVFKVAIVFNLVLYGVLLTAGVLLWNVAYATGTVDNLERFFESFGWSEFEFDGGAIYHASWIAGLFGVIGLTGATVLGATLFNLITDLVGGIRMTVLEEEVQERTQAPMRRFVVRRPTSGTDPSVGLRREVDRFERPDRLAARDQPPTSPPTAT